MKEGCNSVQFGESPTFRRNISMPSSGSKSMPSQRQVARCHGWNDLIVIVLLRTEPSLPSLFAGFFLDVVFYADDGGDMLLRNVGRSPNYAALQPSP
jgi:hypothetical protein